ncbi:hypothetical protein CPB86DRAFT_734820, partial [Serendipita vermifera]
MKFREVSMSRGCRFGWLDTFCINKDSSTELDESIRSMYLWYQGSFICFVHLAWSDSISDFNNDPWFGRGWTLQELLAPRRILFMSSKWTQITHRDNDKVLDQFERQTQEGKDLLWSEISDITGIPNNDLLDFKPGLYNIGQRMSWMSKRKTTRVEDTAYCLIGIFDINLAIAYGEKEWAFYRLQAEIMQNSDDRSL